MFESTDVPAYMRQCVTQSVHISHTQPTSCTPTSALQMLLCVALPLLSVGGVADISRKVLQAQTVADMVGTEEEAGIADKAVVVDTVVQAEQQGTCAVLVSAVGVLQGQDQVLAYSPFVGCD